MIKPNCKICGKPYSIRSLEKGVCIYCEEEAEEIMQLHCENDSLNNDEGCSNTFQGVYGKYRNFCPECRETVTIKMPSVDPLLSDDPLVSSPNHYALPGGVQVIELIKFLQGQAGLTGHAAYCYGNMLKYLTRLGRKDATLRDAEKALTYGLWLVEELKKTTKKELPICTTCLIPFFGPECPKCNYHSEGGL